jgi:hypothetical protein
MKTQIVDAEALRAITPAAISAFARAEGWIRVEPFGQHSDVYGSKSGAEIILPRTDRLGDYPTVVSDLISIFANATERDELSVYRDLTGADRDVIRVRCFTGVDDGSVELDTGVKIVSQSRDMLLAAACAAKQPQPLFRAGSNKDASDYMRRVRLGQTEHGSFVVTLLAPVPPALQAQGVLDPQWVSMAEEPYDRQVTRKLVQALEASREAAENVAAGAGMKAFEEAVEYGVSANLCEALSEMIVQSNGLDVSLTWARTRPTPEPLRRIQFSVADAEILKEAARTFRARHPIHNVSLYGTVHKLKRDQDDVEGHVTLKAVIEDKLQSVSAILDQANYSEAVKAHDEKSHVLVKGDLERVGQRWQLTNAGIIARLAESEDCD